MTYTNPQKFIFGKNSNRKMSLEEVYVAYTGRFFTLLPNPAIFGKFLGNFWEGL